MSAFAPTESNAPWQFEWKRPRLAKSVAVEHDSRLKGMVSIDCKSARLTPAEACSIIDHIRQKSVSCHNKTPIEKQDGDVNKEHDRMKWEDLESSSDEEDGFDTHKYDNSKSQEDDYVLTITILASEMSVKLFESLQDHDLSKSGGANEHLIADSIYLEVTKNSTKIGDSNNEDFDGLVKDGDEEVKVISRTLLQWPSSALVDLESKRKSNSIQTEAFNTWQSVQKALHLTKPSERKEDIQSNELNRILESKAKILRHRIGLTSFALCRRTNAEESDDKLDFDDMYDILDRMALGTISKTDHPLPSSGRYGVDDDPTKAIDIDEIQNELLLSCLTNDGKIYMFSALDLLLHPVESQRGQKGHKTPFHTSQQIDDTDDILSNGFETLLFGRELRSKLKESVLPLSRPRASISLSVVDGINNIEDTKDESKRKRHTLQHKKNVGHNNSEYIKKRETPSVAEDTSNLKTDQTDHEHLSVNPLIDFSFLDSNIEPSTSQYRTIKNVSMICVAAFEYIVIGGRGIRKYSDRKTFPTEMPPSNDTNIFIHESKYAQGKKTNSKGGFVSFISLKHFSEARTVFLPFAPRLLSPVTWNNMHLVVVIGYREDQCLAIRTDTSSIVPFHPNIANGDAMLPSSNNNYSHIPSISEYHVKKFSLIEISFQGQHSCFQQHSNTIGYPVSVTSMTTNPPCIIFSHFDGSNFNMTLHKMEMLQQKQNQDSQFQIHQQGNESQSKGSLKKELTIVCVNEGRHKVQIPAPAELNCEKKSTHLIDYNSLWCVCGKGWSLLGVELKGTIDLFFIIWEGAKEDAYHKKVGSGRLNHFSQSSNILPIRASQVTSMVYPQIITSLDSSSSEPAILSEDDRSRISDSVIVDIIEEIRKEMCSVHPSMVSQFLLKKSSTWAALIEKKELVDHQIAVATFRYSGVNYFLTLRGNVATGNDTPFQEILSWLCQQKDFYTAASVALNLLNDSDTFQDLTGYERNYSRELLDGIIPLESIPQCTTRQVQFTYNVGASNTQIDPAFTSLADMTVVCLIKGGSDMSHALDGFLGRNKYYDTSKACLILGASAAQSVSQVSQLDQINNLAPFSFNPLLSETHTLWPIQCLLRVAVARKCMSTALLLLNATIPNEMRHLSVHDSTSSVALCKSIVSMILASSPTSASILLNLVHSGTTTYWASISTETRFELSLLQSRGKYPLFHETEVRQWALELLHTGTGLIKNSLTEIDLPTTWLQKICLACLHNAECDFTLPELNGFPEEKDESLEKNMFLQHVDEEMTAMKIITSTRGTIDFDLIIPSLLLLEKRQLNWNDDFMISTQSVLNVVCHMAGKPSSNEFIFAFDGASVMRQCVLMGNIVAASNLIGGNDGIVLRCANVITFGDAKRVQEAEDFLVGKIDSAQFGVISEEDNSKTGNEFVLTDGHHEILWCLEKYVLNARKYGEFFSLSTRGSADPTFAARVCLRAWLSLCERKETYRASGRWLEQWLTAVLQNDDKMLARAAITRCLLWTEMQGDKNEKIVLGESLGLSSHFLVMICKKTSTHLIMS